jgi:hypothetical protein
VHGAARSEENPRRRRIGRLLLGAALIAAAAGAVELHYIRFLFVDRVETGRFLSHLPYRKMPGLVPFAEEVLRRTGPEDEIAVVLPFGTWEEAYGYAFHRASYLLAGRRLIPILSWDNRPLPENLAGADYAASWRVAEISGFEPVFRRDDWILWRRMK